MAKEASRNSDPGLISWGEIEPKALHALGFEETTIERGAAYQQQGRATLVAVKISDVSVVLTAQVRGSQPRPYEQTITLSRAPGGRLEMKNVCSCPMGGDCKHVAAVLLQWRSREDTPSDSRRAESSAETIPTPLKPALPPGLATWLRELGDTIQRSDEQAADLRKRLYYAIRRTEDGAVWVDVLACDLDRDGRPRETPKAYDAHIALNATPPKFLRANDLSTLSRLVRLGGVTGRTGSYRLNGAEGALLLAEIIATGRAHWGTTTGPVLRTGNARESDGVWIVAADGSQRFGLQVRGSESLEVLTIMPPHYVDPVTGEVGPLRSALPDLLLRQLLAAPPIAPENAEAAREALESILPPGVAPNLRRMPSMETARKKLRPLARLTQKALPRWRYDPPQRGAWRDGPAPSPTVPALELSFDYGGVLFRPDDPSPARVQFDGARLRQVQRDLKAEQGRFRQLEAAGFEPFPQDWSYGRRPERPATMWLGPEARAPDHVRFILDVKPALEAQGWTIEIDPDFPIQIARVDDNSFEFGVLDAPPESSGIDWFDVSLGVAVDGERLDLLPVFSQILNSLPAGQEAEALSDLLERANVAASRLLVTLPDRRILPIDLGRVGPILQALLAVWGPTELQEGARLHRSHAGDFLELEARLAGQAAVTGGKALAALARELATWRDRAPAAAPTWFTASLRPYQQTGVDWLQMLSRAGYGGILADDMGLGKTVQMLAHLSIEKEAGRLDAPALVVAPTSVLANWRSETERFAPGLGVRIHQGADRTREEIDTSGVDLVVTSYPLLTRDQKLLLDRTWSIVALDEAQTIRNPQSGVALAAFALKARQRVALSGTPVENHLGDVWSLMRFLNPGLLGDARSFRALFRTPIEKQQDAGASTRLARRLKPFLLRRTKGEVAADLPPKTELRETVTLTAAQRQLYEATRLVMQKKVREALDRRGLSRSAIVILDALLKLRQACCDPRLVRSATAKAKAGGSAKLDRLIELVEALKSEGRSALVFSQFTSMLSLIREAFMARGWEHEWLTGDTEDRAGPVARFQSGAADLFLISLKAGGTGLNLTRADTVILYDPWWNPAVEAQAIDRAHRIGRTAPVFVHRLIAEDTIEEKMLELQARKKGFADALWEGEAGGFAGLSADDVANLFD